MQMPVSLPISSWCKLVFSVSANVLGAEAVSEFTDKSLFKERKRSFSPKALFEVQKRLLTLPTVISSWLKSN